MLIRSATAALLFAGMAFVSAPTFATNIAVTNFSFEANETGASGATSGICPTGWLCTPGASGFTVGTYSPVSTQYPPGANGLPGNRTVPSDGSIRTNPSNPSGGYEALYINFVGGPGETVSQNTSTLIANNTTYTLDVWIGHRNDTPWGNAIIQLLANGAVMATSGALADPGSGKWADNSLTFTTGAIDIHAGQTLGIALINNSANTIGQTNFDVVTLTATSNVPEPSTMLLLGPAFVGFVAVRRRMSKKDGAKIVAK